MIRFGCITILMVLASSLGSPILAHELRPGYLEVRELDAGNFDLLWKVPARGDLRLALYVRLPDNCQSTEPGSRFVDGAYIERWRARCEGGLVGRDVAIDGLSATRTDVLVRVQRADGSSQTTRLTADTVSFTYTATPSFIALTLTYITLGIEHILLGVDHLLFVLGLLWIVRGTWRLVGTITAFTVAHSITLAAATLGWIGVPEGPVNAAIALSIVIIGVEVIRLRRGVSGLTARYPWLVAFAFGLLHGLGFATALTELGLPAGDVPLALLLFNIGVEVGQITFVLLVLALAWSCRVLLVHWPRWSHTAAVYAVGSIAAFWFIERTVLLLNA